MASGRMTAGGLGAAVTPGRRAAALRLVRFGIVGASGFVVNEGLLYVGHGVFRLPLLLASVLAIECAIVTNYLLNDRWTFQHRRPTLMRFVRFNAVSLVSLVVNLAVLGLLTRFTRLDYRAANAVAVAAASGANYVLNVYWTYGTRLTTPYDQAEEPDLSPEGEAGLAPTAPARGEERGRSGQVAER